MHNTQYTMNRTSYIIKRIVERREKRVEWMLLVAVLAVHPWPYQMRGVYVRKGKEGIFSLKHQGFLETALESEGKKLGDDDSGDLVLLLIAHCPIAHSSFSIVQCRIVFWVFGSCTVDIVPKALCWVWYFGL